MGDKKVRRRFFFHLQKQKTKHILLLIGETVLLPVSGLMALLPGPNVFFGVLALLIYTHWQALRGIQRLSRAECTFIPSRLLSQWKDGLGSLKEADCLEVLEKMETEYQLTNLRKILYK